MGKPAPIFERIRSAMGGRREAPYHEIIRAVFPPESFPRAWRYSANGGPPGCAMAFGAAIRRMGGRHSSWNNKVWFDRPLAGKEV